MGFVPLVIWFCCVTTLLLLVSTATLARTRKQADAAKERWQDSWLAWQGAIASLSQELRGQLPADVQYLLTQTHGIAAPEAVLKSFSWHKADVSLYQYLQSNATNEQVARLRQSLVASAKAQHSYQKAAEAYNGFVKTLPTSYGAILFGYKPHQLA